MTPGKQKIYVRAACPKDKLTFKFVLFCFVLFFLSKPYSNLQSASFTFIESLSGSPPGSYSQLIPSHHTPVTVRDGMHSSVPPVLPPHLLHVILNKEVVDHNDPSLLPEPDHVSLNHLYALSIKVITGTWCY